MRDELTLGFGWGKERERERERGEQEKERVSERVGGTQGLVSFSRSGKETRCCNLSLKNRADNYSIAAFSDFTG